MIKFDDAAVWRFTPEFTTVSAWLIIALEWRTTAALERSSIVRSSHIHTATLQVLQELQCRSSNNV
jgi:hypothetical protein